MTNKWSALFPHLEGDAEAHGDSPENQWSAMFPQAERDSGARSGSSRNEWSSVFPRSERDIAACREMLRIGSQSFYAASMILPQEIRLPASALYAFCRIAVINEVVGDALRIFLVGKVSKPRQRRHAGAGAALGKPARLPGRHRAVVAGGQQVQRYRQRADVAFQAAQVPVRHHCERCRHVRRLAQHGAILAQPFIIDAASGARDDTLQRA